jgi:REP element-mobilizing transposase RayT
VPGGLFHVILRGNARQTIFFDAEDRQRWELLIAEGLDRYGHRLHAYCWMPNHVHMAVRSGDAPLAGFMRFVASGYARSTNKKLKRSGHFFERRHRAILVDADTYLLGLVRYIHRNPLRAGLGATLADYPWASPGAYQTGVGPAWFSLDSVRPMFALTPARARRAYPNFMARDDSPLSPRGLAEGVAQDPHIFGSERFLSSRRGARKSPGMNEALDELARRVCRQHGVSIGTLRSPSRAHRLARVRAEITVKATDHGFATNAELARYCDRSQAALCRAARTRRREMIKK